MSCRTLFGLLFVFAGTSFVQGSPAAEEIPPPLMQVGSGSCNYRWSPGEPPGMQEMAQASALARAWADYHETGDMITAVWGPNYTVGAPQVEQWSEITPFFGVTFRARVTSTLTWY